MGLICENIYFNTIFKKIGGGYQLPMISQMCNSAFNVHKRKYLVGVIKIKVYRIFFLI